MPYKAISGSSLQDWGPLRYLPCLVKSFRRLVRCEIEPMTTALLTQYPLTNGFALIQTFNLNFFVFSQFIILRVIVDSSRNPTLAASGNPSGKFAVRKLNFERDCRPKFAMSGKSGLSGQKLEASDFPNLIGLA